MSTLSGLRGWVRVALRAATASPPSASAARAPTVRTSPMPGPRRVGEHLLGTPERVGDGGGDQLGEARLAGRAPGVQRRLTAVGVVVEHDLAEVDRVDAVDQRLVHLGDHGEAVALEALDDVHLPERPGAVQPARLHPRDELLELLLRARASAGPGAARG